MQWLKGLRAKKSILRQVMPLWLLVGLLFSADSWADDLAQRHILGFSPDGRYFAFEQYGIEDPSGNVFSEIFVINTHGNTFVSGTPIKTVVENSDDRELYPREAREQNRKKAEKLLDKLQIRPNFRVFATNRMTEENADHNRLSFRIGGGRYGAAYDLVMKQFQLKVPDKTPPIAGFTLEIGKGLEPGQEGELVGGYPRIHLPMRTDGLPDYSAIPHYSCQSAYSCAGGYGIADVIFSENYENGGVLVVLIAVHYSGHNYSKGRYIAIARPWGYWGRLGVAR